MSPGGLSRDGEIIMLPRVDFCGLKVTRLILGGNPFGGYSHQSKARNEEMLAYYTPERIIETLHRAEAAGINTFIMNNGPDLVKVIRRYRNEGGQLQWIAQLSHRYTGCTMRSAVAEAVEVGASAAYIHGREVELLCEEDDGAKMTSWLDCVREHGIPAGVAGHAAEVHRWVDALNTADFHAVCFFRCGSVHDGLGLKFKLRDMPGAVECIRAIQKPCIGYKIMAAGRIDPYMAFEYAFNQIKPSDVVNVGMHRGDKDDMVEENVKLVREVLNLQASAD